MQDPESFFCKFLTNSLEHEKGDGIDYESLVCLAILHCVDKKKKPPVNKAIALYELLQDGGAEKQKYISASDKDWQTVMPKYLTMATIAPNQGCGQNFYGRAEFEKFEQAFTVVTGFDDEENSIIDTVFGVNSNLTYEAFIEGISTKTPWAFSAKELRQRVHDTSNVPIRHIN